ncbi:hypothetical protein SAY87_005638 [Trapa incisa]|uniref:Aminopeptidase P N-terminal domain-containing protein n=1 Tax=Trapa incisa TaxID=236973 RepID=A0AAN7QC13_9MYRT|nr:hypothetical protein SAY87_005638 [Trapa incisa]
MLATKVLCIAWLPMDEDAPPPRHGFPMELHGKNREKILRSLRQHLAESYQFLSGFVFLQGDEEQTRHDTDHIELFTQESYFAYLFGVVVPGFFGATDVMTGNSILFAPRLPADYAIWLGEIKLLPFFQCNGTYGLDTYLQELERLKELGPRSLRTARKLLEGMNGKC